MDKILEKIPYDKLANFKKMHAIIASVILMAGVFLGYYMVVHSALQDDVRELEGKQVQAEEKLKSYQAEVAQTDTITKQLATIAGDLVQKKSQLPLVKELPALLNKITDVGDFLSVRILNFELEGAKEKEFYREIPIKMSIAGDYYRTAGFFDTLQGLLRMVNISKLKMEVKNIPVEVIGPDGVPQRKSVKLLETTIEAKTFAYIEGSEFKQSK